MRNSVRLNAFTLVILLCAALSPLALSGPALGQQPVQSNPGRDDPAHLAAAKALLETAGSAKLFDSVVPLLAKQLEATFVQLKPEHAAEIKEAFARMPEKFSARKQELIDQIAKIYAERFTTEELNEVSKFLGTPVGQKFVSQQAVIAQQSMALGNAWGQKIGQEIEQEIRKELQERGIKL